MNWSFHRELQEVSWKKFTFFNDFSTGLAKRKNLEDSKMIKPIYLLRVVQL